jgi:uncharacterized membrane protein HdeD (DUF308 family)
MADRPVIDTPDPSAETTLKHSGLQVLRDNGGRFFVLGISLIVAGAMAIGLSWMAGSASVIALGILLLLGGAAQIVGAFFGRRWGGLFLELPAGMFHGIIGLLMIDGLPQMPNAITVMVAAFFIFGGAFRIFVAVAERFESWGWLLSYGIVNLVLGILLWRQWPLSGLWEIGPFVGIQMISLGGAWVTLSVLARRRA